MIEEAFEAIRTSFPLGFLVMFPVILIAVSPVAVVDAAHEFTVYRMQQYDLQGTSYGETFRYEIYGPQAKSCP